MRINMTSVNKKVQDNWSSIFLIVVKSLVISISANLLALILLYAYAFAASGSLIEAKTRIYIFVTSGTSFYLIQFAMFVLYSSVLFFSEKKLRNTKEDGLFSLFKPIKLKIIFYSISAGLILVMLLAIMNAVSMQAEGAEIGASSAGKITRLSQADLNSISVKLVESIPIMGFLGPFAEEVFFRGILFTFLLKKTNNAIAIIVSSLVFSTMHFAFFTNSLIPGLITSIIIFFIGVISAYYYSRYKSLWPCVLLHCTYNISLIFISYLSGVISSASQ